MLKITEVHQALYALQAMNLNFQIQGQAEFWTPVLNDVMPEMDNQLLTRAVNLLASGRVSMTRSTAQPSDIVNAARLILDGDLEAQRVRLKEELSRGGDFAAEGITDGNESVTWKQTAVKTFMGGASREEAERAAWAAIEKEPPKPQKLVGFQPDIDKIGK